VTRFAGFRGSNSDCRSVFPLVQSLTNLGSIHMYRVDQRVNPCAVDKWSLSAAVCRLRSSAEQIHRQWAHHGSRTPVSYTSIQERCVRGDDVSVTRSSATQECRPNKQFHNYGLDSYPPQPSIIIISPLFEERRTRWVEKIRMVYKRKNPEKKWQVKK